MQLHFVQAQHAHGRHVARRGAFRPHGADEQLEPALLQRAGRKRDLLQTRKRREIDGFEEVLEAFHVVRYEAEAAQNEVETLLRGLGEGVADAMGQIVDRDGHAGSEVLGDDVQTDGSGDLLLKRVENTVEIFLSNVHEFQIGELGEAVILDDAAESTNIVGGTLSSKHDRSQEGTAVDSIDPARLTNDVCFCSSGGNKRTKVLVHHGQHELSPSVTVLNNLHHR